MGPLGGDQLVIEEEEDMQKALHIRTTVLPWGKIEFVGHELPTVEFYPKDNRASWERVS